MAAPEGPRTTTSCPLVGVTDTRFPLFACENSITKRSPGPPPRPSREPRVVSDGGSSRRVLAVANALDRSNRSTAAFDPRAKRRARDCIGGSHEPEPHENQRRAAKPLPISRSRGPARSATALCVGGRQRVIHATQKRVDLRFVALHARDARPALCAFREMSANGASPRRELLVQKALDLLVIRMHRSALRRSRGTRGALAPARVPMLASLKLERRRDLPVAVALGLQQEQPALALRKAVDRAAARVDARSPPAAACSADGGERMPTRPPWTSRRSRCLRCRVVISLRKRFIATLISHASGRIRHRASPVQTDERFLRQVGRQVRIARQAVENPSDPRNCASNNATNWSWNDAFDPDSALASIEEGNRRAGECVTTS